MPTAYILEPFDLIEQIGSALIARAILDPARPLGFQTREKTLHRRVVPDVAATAHAASDAALMFGDRFEAYS